MYPFLNLFGIQISSYFLIISISTLISCLWFLQRAGRHNLNKTTALDLTICVLVSGFIGARLLHVAYEEPDFYRMNLRAVFEIWNGGFVFLGGVLGAFIGGALFCSIRREPFWFWADVATPPLALAYALGRIGCLLNGCCYGKFCELPWAIYLEGGLRHPTQLYASLWEVVALLILVRMEPRVRMAGLLFSSWAVLHSLGRVMMEYFRDDPRGPMMYGLSIGTWMSLVLGLFGAMNILLRRGHRRLV